MGARKLLDHHVKISYSKGYQQLNFQRFVEELKSCDLSSFFNRSGQMQD